MQAWGQMVWLIEPESHMGYIYRAGGVQRQTIGAEEELDGESVIPGFKLKLSKLFE